jgi:hypothetical protein
VSPASGDVVPNIPPERPLPREENSSPVGDLFAPFFDVVFYAVSTEKGEDVKIESDQDARLRNTAKIGTSSITLRTVGGGLESFSPSGEDTELGQLANYKASLEVTMLSAAALQATLTLTPPYEAALEIIDHKIIKFGSLMEIQWGYLALDGSGAPAISDKGLFRITQPSIKFGQQVTVTIAGFDILSGSLGSQDTRCVWLRETYPCDLDIVSKIVKTRVGQGAKLNDKSLSANSKLRKKKSGEGVTQTDDDWTFLRRLCRQNDAVFTQRGSELFLEDEERVSAQKPKYTLFWYGQPESETDVPMISFETNPIMSLFAGDPGARGQRTLCRDPEEKKVTVTNKDPAKTGQTQTGEANTITSDKAHEKEGIQTSEGTISPFAELDAACASGRFFTEPCRRPNVEEETDRENNEIRQYFNTRASAVCPGVPGLLPQQVVHVKNVGKTFSGNYRVMKVIHSIGAGYTMKVDLLRASESNAKTGTATTDPTNTKPADPNAEAAAPVEPILVADEDFASGRGCVDAAATNERNLAIEKAEDAKRAKEASDAAAAAKKKAQGGTP